jgi:hypothetical protein
MGIETLSLVFLLTICLIMGVSLVIVIQDLFKMEKKLGKSEEENLAFKNALQKEADIVIEDAHKRAMHVIDEANRKAMEIVASSENYNDEAKKAIKQNIDAVTKAESQQITQVGDQMLQAYQAALQGVKAEGNEIVKNISKDLETHATAEVSEFTSAVKKETIESQELIQKRLNEEYQTIQKEVEVYKQQQLKKAQEEIFQIVRMLTETALGKGLTIGQHQSIVMEALEEAKAQGVIR